MHVLHVLALRSGSPSSVLHSTSNHPFLSTILLPLHTIPSFFSSLQSRKPPPVIPYQRHLEGKRKLAESLRQSGIIPDASDRDRANSLSQVPVGILLNFTPPDTPRSTTSADQSSLDRSERASLDSKGSNEASISSGEVATGNLVDLSTSGTNTKRVNLINYSCVLFNSHKYRCLQVTCRVQERKDFEPSNEIIFHT